MSLQVWLPLNGNIDNRGLLGYQFNNNASAYVSTAGKIGSCYVFESMTGTGLQYQGNVADFMNNFINNNSWTLSAWIKSTATDTAVFGLTYGLRLFAGTTPNVALYNSSRTVTATNSHSTTDGNWHHLAATYNVETGAVCVYVDGIAGTVIYYPSGCTYASSWTNGVYIGRDPNNSTASAHYFFQGSLNDIRIYNNCLTTAEIKDLAKCLTIHYPLNDRYIETTTNCAKYPTPGSAITPGWDTSKHQNAISVSNWSSGYNSGVTSPTTGYHAMWNVIDNIPTIVFQDKNSEISQTHRWLGISGGGLTTSQITSGTTYTVSFDAKANVSGKQVSCGLYYKKTSDGSNGFHDGCPQFSITTEWKRYTYTYTCAQMYSISSFYFYGHYGAEGIAYVRNIQIEIKAYATPYTPSSRSGQLTYDTSGYSNNATPSSTLITTTDTARYSRAAEWVDSASAITIGNLSTLIPEGIFTFNVWFKKETGKWSSKGYETILGGPSGFELEGKPGGTNTNKIRLYSWGGSDGSKDFTYPLDQWNMLTMVRTTSATTWYLNGVQVQTGTAGSIPSGTYFLGSWNSATQQNYLGKMSDARFYATALSATDVLELYNTPIMVAKSGTLITKGEIVE